MKHYVIIPDKAIEEMKKVNSNNYRAVWELKKMVDHVSCNFCGKMGKEFFQGGSGKVSFGYGSKYDTTYYDFDVCDDCFDKHFKPLKDKVKPTSYMGEF